MCCLLVTCGCSPAMKVLMEPGHQLSTIPHLRFESDNTEKLMVYEGFVVKFDSSHKVPGFVTQVITPEQLTDSLGIKAKRSNRFWVDQSIIAGLSATSADYRKSGYDRGHHAPAGDFVYSQSLKDESFVYTNISPQNAKLNRGPLAKLEKQVREKVDACQCNAYVITGTHFEDKAIKTIGTNEVGVPDYIYKVIYYPELGRMYAFLLDNRLKEYLGDLFHHQQTVDAIEALTGEDFFDQLQDALETALEKKLSSF